MSGRLYAGHAEPSGSLGFDHLSPTALEPIAGRKQGRESDTALEFCGSSFRDRLASGLECKMSTDTATTPGRFRPESAGDFSQRSRRLSRWLGLPYQRSQELLARIYGYSGFHELRKTLERAGEPGPFDALDSTAQTGAERDRAQRVARVIAEIKGVGEAQLSPRERAVAAMGLFLPSAEHRSMFNALTKSIQTTVRSRRVVMAPTPSHPAPPVVFVDVECSEDEEVVWEWTHTPMGRYVCGYRLVPLK